VRMAAQTGTARTRTGFVARLCRAWKATAAWSLVTLAFCACHAQQPVRRLVGRRVVLTRSISPRAYEHATRALLYEQQGLWGKAAAAFEQAVSYDPQAAELRARWAEVLLHAGETEAAAEQINLSLKSEATTLGLAAKAHLALEQGDLESATDALKEAAERAGFDTEPETARRVHWELAETQLARNNLDGALDPLLRLVQAQPEQTGARHRLGALYWALGSTEEAQTHWRLAALATPASVESQLMLAWLHTSQGSNTAAEQALQDALAETRALAGAPETLSAAAWEVATTAAAWHVQHGKKRAARTLITDVLGTSRGSQTHSSNTTSAESSTHLPHLSLSVETLSATTELLTAGGQDEQALALLTAARLDGHAGLAVSRREEAPKDTEQEQDDATPLIVAEAAIYERQNKPQMALERLSDIPERSRYFLDALLWKSQILVTAGRFPEAHRHLDSHLDNLQASDVIRSRTDRLRLAQAKAHIFAEEARFDEALQTLGRLDGAVRADLALFEASLLEQSGDWRAALDLAESQVQRDPLDPRALNFWGFVAAEHGHQLSQALARIRTALALAPEQGAIVDSLGWAHFKIGNWHKAHARLTQATRLSPKDAEIWMHLGQSHAQAGRHKDARATFEHALTLEVEAHTRTRLHELIRSLNNTPGTTD